MIVNDHDAVNAPGLTVFCDVWEITGISLPDFTEFVFFIGLAVTEVRVSGRFEVVVADETLYGIHADSCREKGFLHEMLINLCGIHAWMVIFHTINFSNGFIIQSPGNAFVRPDTGHQGIQPAEVVLGFPLFQCFVAIADRGTIRKGQWRGSDPLVVGRSRGIRIKPLDDRSYESEAELCHFSVMFESFSIFAHGKDLLLMFFFIIRGELAAIHPMVVWSEDRNIRSKHFLMVLCVF